MGSNILNKHLVKFYMSQTLLSDTALATNTHASEVVNQPEVKKEDFLSESKNMYPNKEEKETGNIEAKEVSKQEEEEKPKMLRKRKTEKAIKSNTKTVKPSSRPTARFSDFGGIEATLKEVDEFIKRPLFYPSLYRYLGVDPPRGVLLVGPSGCGKTHLANAIGGEYNVPFLKFNAPEIVGGVSGESESKLRDTFDEAKSLAPCILFIDEIDAIITKKELAQKEMEKRIISQLNTCMDEISYTQPFDKPVIVIAATNSPEALDPSLRRAGRFDHEVKMGIPNEGARLSILNILARNLRLDNDVDAQDIARNTPGYAGADLKMLIREAAMQGLKRIFGELMNSNLNTLMQVEPSPESIENNMEDTVHHLEGLNEELLSQMFVKMEDFKAALGRVQPSAKREGFAVVPDVSWSDIGALLLEREELRMAVVEPLRHPEIYKFVGINSPAGVLLWGPPGCGKTLLAKAVANESHSNFISIKGPELLNKYVGESEKAVRQVFERARSSSPCVIFFDELDALCPKRDGDANAYSARIVNQLLTEMDGLEERQQVYVIGATNRPDIIDPAMLRPGRLDKLIYVGLPGEDERYDILKKHTKNTPLDKDVNLKSIAQSQETLGFSGADLAALVREASLSTIRDILKTRHISAGFKLEEILVKNKDFELALKKVFPSVSVNDQKMYKSLNDKFRTKNT